MDIANNTIETRIQLKSDTETNWNKLGPSSENAGFIPLRGELIIYTPDDSHAFCRLKVGDGVNNIVALPFIDAGTLNGEEVEVVKVATYTDLPQEGSDDKLYIVLNTKKIYHYSNGYNQLSNFSYSTTKSTVSNIIAWLPGITTKAVLEHGILKITTGSLPELLWKREEVVSALTKEGS